MQFLIPVGNFVKKAGDTMAGTLDIQAGDLIAPEVVVTDGVVRTNVDNAFVEFLGSTEQLKGAALKMMGEDSPTDPGSGILTYGGEIPLANPLFLVIYIQTGIPKTTLMVNKVGNMFLPGVDGGGGNLDILGGITCEGGLFNSGIVCDFLTAVAAVSGVSGNFSGTVQANKLTTGGITLEFISVPITILNGTSSRSVIIQNNLDIHSLSYVAVHTGVPGVTTWLTSHADVKRLVSIDYVKATGVLQIASSGNVSADQLYRIMVWHE